MELFAINKNKAKVTTCKGLSHHAKHVLRRYMCQAATVCRSGRRKCLVAVLPKRCCAYCGAPDSMLVASLSTQIAWVFWRLPSFLHHVPVQSSDQMIPCSPCAKRSLCKLAQVHCVWLYIRLKNRGNAASRVTVVVPLVQSQWVHQRMPQRRA